MTSTPSGIRAELVARFGQRAVVAEAALGNYARDFGGVVHRMPVAAVRVASVDDVRDLFRWAYQAGVQVGLRGAGHSQSGHPLCESGVILDTTALSAIEPLDADSRLAHVDGGARWLDVVTAAYPLGLLPEALTMTVNPTVGGTLSAGGVGGRSWVLGAQVNSVEYVDVVIPDGRLLRCSAQENAELFDCARAGLGQFGVIVSAGIRLRRCGQRLHTLVLEYSRAATFVDDLAELMRRGGDHHLLGQFRSSTLQPGRWSACILLGVEAPLGEHPDLELLISKLSFDYRHETLETPLWSADNAPGHEFFWTAEWADLDDWGRQHPWVDHFLSFKLLRTMTEEIVEHGKTRIVKLGQTVVIPFRPSGRAAPLLRHPAVDASVPGCVGVGVFFNLPQEVLDQGARVARTYSDHWQKRGGIRYLTGYLGWETADDWRGHFGDRWDWFCRMKEKYDPNRVLGPGPLTWA